jgi:hypothetical protein
MAEATAAPSSAPPAVEVAEPSEALRQLRGGIAASRAVSFLVAVRTYKVCCLPVRLHADVTADTT